MQIQWQEWEHYSRSFTFKLGQASDFAAVEGDGGVIMGSLGQSRGFCI